MKKLSVAKHSSKPRDIALHAGCGKETIAPVASATSTTRVFLPYASLPSAFSQQVSKPKKRSRVFLYGLLSIKKADLPLSLIISNAQQPVYPSL